MSLVGRSGRTRNDSDMQLSNTRKQSAVYNRGAALRLLARCLHNPFAGGSFSTTSGDLYPGTWPLGIAECESAAQQVAAQTETTSFQASSKDGDVVLKKNDTLHPCVLIGYLKFFFCHFAGPERLAAVFSCYRQCGPVGMVSTARRSNRSARQLKEDNEAFQLSLGRQ